MDKELLIREYFALKYKFAKLHNSEVLFKEEPTNEEIKIYSEEFTIEELQNRIASIKTQLELKGKVE
jgi:hypothetical protein